MDPNFVLLTRVLLTLADLAAWANNQLDNEHADRQLIAEHLTASIRSVVLDTDPVPTLGR
jgi:hypothetical protein